MNEPNRLCIICRKNKPKLEFNIEHIFPDTIGGDLKIFSVCIICNKKLSDNFDISFLKDARIGLYRQALQLNRSGRNRGIANPLIDAKVEGEDGENYYITFKDGQPQLNSRPKIKTIEEENVERVIVTASSDKLEEVLDNFLNKRGFDKSDIANIKESNVPVTKAVSFITISKYIMMEGVKIAYEFTASILPTYLDDPWSNKYSDFLEAGVQSDFIEEQLDGSDAIMKICLDEYNIIAQLPWHIHAVFAKSYENFGLVCIVKIFNFICFYRMSDQCILDFDADIFLTLDPVSRTVYREK